MIRLKIDEVTGRILGWERITDYLQIYSTDLIVAEEIDGLAIGRYYQDGKIVTRQDDDYHSQKALLDQEARDLTDDIADGREHALTAVLDGSIQELKAQTELKEANLAVVQQRLADLVGDHAARLADLWKARNAAIDDALEIRHYSAAVLLIKNENQYLEEWVRWHLDLGFDHIYIYDNGPDEPVITKIQDSLQDISDKITVVDFSGDHENLQTEAYTHFWECAGKQVRWAAMLDSDEFLRLPGGQKLNAYLQQYEEYTIISCPFIEYNANGQEAQTDAPVRERFTREAECLGNMTNKNLVQINRIDGFRTHFPIFDPGKHLVLYPDKDTLVMDHYYTKSFEEWCRKMQRGSCDPNWLRKFDEFFWYNPDMEYLRDQVGANQSYGGAKNAI